MGSPVSQSVPATYLAVAKAYLSSVVSGRVSLQRLDVCDPAGVASLYTKIKHQAPPPEPFPIGDVIVYHLGEGWGPRAEALRSVSVDAATVSANLDKHQADSINQFLNSTVLMRRCVAGISAAAALGAATLPFLF